MLVSNIIVHVNFKPELIRHVNKLFASRTNRSTALLQFIADVNDSGYPLKLSVEVSKFWTHSLFDSFDRDIAEIYREDNFQVFYDKRNSVHLCAAFLQDIIDSYNITGYDDVGNIISLSKNPHLLDKQIRMSLIDMIKGTIKDE